jgi:hypothetical protein
VDRDCFRRDRSTTAPIKAVARLDGHGLRSLARRHLFDVRSRRPATHFEPPAMSIRTRLAPRPHRHRTYLAPRTLRFLGSPGRLHRSSCSPPRGGARTDFCVGHRAHSLVSWSDALAEAILRLHSAGGANHDAGERVPRSPWAPVTRCFISAARVRCSGRRVTLSPRPRRSIRSRRSRSAAPLSRDDTPKERTLAIEPL